MSARLSFLSYANAFFGPFFGLWCSLFLTPVFEKFQWYISSGIFALIAIICSTHIYGITKTADISSETPMKVGVSKLKYNIASLICFLLVMIILPVTFPTACSFNIGQFGMLIYLWWSIITFLIITYT